MKLPVGAIGSLKELRQFLKKEQTKFYYTANQGRKIRDIELDNSEGCYTRTEAQFSYMFCLCDDKIRLFANYWYAWAYTEKNKAGIE